MDDKLINPIPEFVTAEERESILAYRKLSKGRKGSICERVSPELSTKG